MVMKHIFTAITCVLLAACTQTIPDDISTELSSSPKGNANSPILVQEFADLQCPACRSAHTSVKEPLLAQYGSQIQFEFVHFPLRQIHRYALPAAMAAECAADQGRFWEYIDHVFENQDTLTGNMLDEYAVAVGVPDMDLFNRCVESEAKREGVLANYEQGRKAEVTGTPTFFVNGVKVNSSLAALSAAIDAEISKIDAQL